MGLIIFITNPFTTNEKDITFNVLNKYESSSFDTNFHTLSDNEQSELITELVNYAKNLSKHDEFDQAINIMEKAIKLKPDRENIYNDLAAIYLGRAFFKGLNNKQRVVKSEDFQKAIDYAKLNIEKFPYSNKNHDALIDIYTFVENYEQGIDIATKACYANPNIKENCYKAGDLYLKVGKKEQAINFYLNLAKKSNYSKDDWIYNKLGYIYAEQGICKVSNKYYKLAYKIHSSHKNLQDLTRPCHNKIIY